MRKILLVQNEQYLDRALQDVGNLIALEQQKSGRNEQVDLLAVILLPLSAMAQLTSEDQTCEDFQVTDSAAPFAPDSVSVNGVWLLLTVSEPDLPQPVFRQEALSRVLRVLQTKECHQSVSTIFPVFSPEEDEGAVAKQVTYLQSEHPRLPITLALSIQCREHSLTAAKVRPRSHAE